MNLIGTLHWTTVLLNLHVQTGLIYARSLTESGPCVSTWLAWGLDVRVAVWLRTWVCLFHFTQGSWVCASLYRRAANMSQSWALKPGYRLQGSKHHKSDDTWISLSKPGNKSLKTTVTIANKCEIAHIPTHLHGLLERNVRLSLFRVTAGLKLSHSPPRWTIRCLGVSKNSRHTSCVGNSRQQHSALVPLWPLGMLYDQLFLKYANMLKQNVAETSNPSTQSAQCEYHRHIRQSDIKITLYCSNLRRWQLYIYREH